ncbi:MAG: ExeA family protein [Paracoccaceae bacterium]
MTENLQIYTEFFGLGARPFTLLPDPDFIYWSDAHQRAYTMLEYGLITHAPITVITGEIGAGKTTLLRELLKKCPDDLTVGLVSNAAADRGEMLHWVMMALDQSVDPELSYVQTFQRFQNFLIEEYAAGRRTVLIFDEAQNLTVESLEELRMYSNINADQDELLQLVLVGQPQLVDLLNDPRLVQFAQRVVAEFHLPNMTDAAVEAYIRHRMAVAGAKRQVFTAAACREIFEASNGTPRLVNQVCDFALVYAYSLGRKTVDDAIVKRVLKDRRRFGVLRRQPPQDGRELPPNAVSIVSDRR